MLSAVKYVTGHLPRIFAAFSYIFAGYAAVHMYIQGSGYAVLSRINETGKGVDVMKKRVLTISMAMLMLLKTPEYFR